MYNTYRLLAMYLRTRRGQDSFSNLVNFLHVSITMLVIKQAYRKVNRHVYAQNLYIGLQQGLGGKEGKETRKTFFVDDNYVERKETVIK